MPIPNMYQGARLGPQPQQQFAPQVSNNANWQQGQQMQQLQQQGLDPAMVQAILSMNQQGAQQNVIDRQRKMADLMRSSGADQLRGVQVGKHYAAPGLLQAAASIYGTYQGMKQDESADAAQKTLGNDRQENLRRYFDAMRGG